MTSLLTTTITMTTIMAKIVTNKTMHNPTTITLMELRATQMQAVRVTKDSTLTKDLAQMNSWKSLRQISLTHWQTDLTSRD